MARVISPRSRDANGGNSLDEIIEIRERESRPELFECAGTWEEKETGLSHSALPSSR